MQDQSCQRVHQGTAEIDVADLEDLVALAFALASARVIASSDQATTSKDLRGVLVVGRVANGCCQANDLDVADSLEFGPHLVRRLDQQCPQVIFQLGNVLLDLFEQRQIVWQELAADGD